ncbi:hypothetical protein VSR34_34890 [Paraburkholderia sp. JHI2823]|uniref:hypothetical protein n=1 Tax=Paraburkholderia sp. JHI2823 TaxID=3112960 RepID=UPI00316DA106
MIDYRISATATMLEGTLRVVFAWQEQLSRDHDSREVSNLVRVPVPVIQGYPVDEYRWSLDQLLAVWERWRPWLAEPTLIGLGSVCRRSLNDPRHMRCLRRIRKTLRLMPLRERCKPRAQGIDRQGFCVIGKVPRDHVSARGQKAAPFNLEMPECRLVTAPGVFARRGFDVAIDGRHGSWVKSGDLYRRR